MQEISDLSADAPYLPEWFFKHVFVPLVEAKRVQLKGAKWLQAEDDIFYLGGHFEILAYLIQYKEKQLGSMKQALEFVSSELG